MIKSVDEKHKQQFIYLLELISSVINGTKPQFKNDVEWMSIFVAAKGHSVENLLYYAVCGFSQEEKNSLPKKILDALNNANKYAILKEANQQYEADLLINEFEKQGIKNMPVKGYFYKHAYPQADMRSMTDIDIVYDSQKQKEVIETIKKCGFIIDTIDDVQICCKKLPFLFLELHKTPVNPGEANYKYFLNSFNMAKKRDNYCYSYEMMPEIAYIYMIDHIAYHFVKGGVGIRMLMDVYIFFKEFSKTVDLEYIKQQLEITNLTKFEQYIKNLAFSWFSPQKVNLEIDRTGEFIILSNTYGRMSVSILQTAIKDSQSQINNNKKPSALKFFLKGIFPSYNRMKNAFPTVGRYPVLYPFSWFYWWYYRGFVKKNIRKSNILSRIKYTDKKNVAYYYSMINSVGLTKYIEDDTEA